MRLLPLRPHPGSGLRVVVLSWLLLLGGLAVPPAVLATSCTLPGAAGDYVERINAIRSSRGLRPLAVDGDLASLAQNHSAAMARAHDLFHTSDLGAGVRADWRSLAENVGMGPDTDAVWNGLVGSPPHLANILAANSGYVGVGVVDEGGTQWTTQRFMGT
jgi:uncharacterized protein YkwD